MLPLENYETNRNISVIFRSWAMSITRVSTYVQIWRSIVSANPSGPQALFLYVLYFRNHLGIMCQLYLCLDFINAFTTSFLSIRCMLTFEIPGVFCSSTFVHPLQDTSLVPIMPLFLVSCLSSLSNYLRHSGRCIVYIRMLLKSSCFTSKRRHTVYKILYGASVIHRYLVLSEVFCLPTFPSKPHRYLTHSVVLTTLIECVS